ncbi:MAG: hypothetical protein JW866_06470 [Ignavibacteriales bacterium]|nr:hypothetical protein [Ignavibacteriales bacterium]
MSTSELKTMIEKYFDNELEKKYEPLLFAELSSNAEARNFFKEMNLLKHSIQQTEEEFPIDLEEKILYSVKLENDKKHSIPIIKNVPAMISYALTVIFLTMTIIFFTETKELKGNLKETINKVKEQEETIELLFNRYKEIEITSNKNNGG